MRNKTRHNRMTTEELAAWNDQMVKKYHTNGTLFESKNPVLRYVEKQRVKVMIRLAELSHNDTVLDVGCGEGYLLSVLPKIKKVVGIDISRVALARARSCFLKNRKDVSFRFGNAEKMPFKDKSFTRVFCSEVLEHTPIPRNVIQEAHRVLRDDGLIVVSIPDEARIQNIMRIIKILGVSKLLHAARKQEDYEWHIHNADLVFFKRIISDYFHIVGIKRVPYVLGYRIVISAIKV